MGDAPHPVRARSRGGGPVKFQAKIRCSCCAGGGGCTVRDRVICILFGTELETSRIDLVSETIILNR